MVGGGVGVGGTGVGGVGWCTGAVGVEGLGFGVPPQVLKFPLQTMRAMMKAMMMRMTAKMIQHLAFFHHMCRFNWTAVFLKDAALHIRKQQPEGWRETDDDKDCWEERRRPSKTTEQACQLREISAVRLNESAKFRYEKL